MYNKERNNRRLYVASFSDDVPFSARGDLIPKNTIYSAPTRAISEVTVWYLRPALLLTLSVLIFAVSIGSMGYSVLRGEMSVAAPIVADLVPVENQEPDPFQYGVILDQKLEDSYLEQKNILVESKETFLEADLIDMKLRLYVNGVATDTAPIISKGASNSWWQVPAGLYEIDHFSQKRYSTFGNIYMPWSMSFDNNYYINGVPFYADHERVPEEYSGGGLRLSDVDAKRFYQMVEKGTPILVREKSFVTDSFLYTTTIPGVRAKGYLVADASSNTLLAAGNMDQILPIASLTKLMTALVAAEDINLDTNIALENNTTQFVLSLIPRLQESTTVSMYSLLQLLLIESSNEAAEVIARHYGRDLFIERMNQKAHAIGLTNTTFTDPSGIDKGNVSTVEDLFRLTQYILNNRGFILELTADQNLPTAYTNGQFGKLANFNHIDGTNFISGKVGETKAAGMTSVSLHAVTIGGVERVVVVIILGTEERSNDVRRIISYITELFE